MWLSHARAPCPCNGGRSSLQGHLLSLAVPGLVRPWPSWLTSSFLTGGSALVSQGLNLLKWITFGIFPCGASPDKSGPSSHALFLFCFCMWQFSPYKTLFCQFVEEIMGRQEPAFFISILRFLMAPRMALFMAKEQWHFSVPISDVIKGAESRSYTEDYNEQRRPCSWT